MIVRPWSESPKLRRAQYRRSARGRADRKAAYRDARAEYERIHALCEVSPVAAHLRERRFELGLTEEEVGRTARPIGNFGRAALKSAAMSTSPQS